MKKSFPAKNLSKVLLMIIFAAILFGNGASCGIAGEGQHFGCADIAYGCAALFDAMCGNPASNQTENQQSASEPQRPEEHQSTTQESEKDVNLGTDQGQVSPGGGSTSGGGGGGHP